MTRRLTEIAHDLIARRVRDGDIVIDATMGNGHDTLFLADLVGERGHVHAFDVQQRAIDKTGERLAEHGLSNRATLIRESHAEMTSHLPQEASGQIAAVVFNLGYLPGGEKRVTTTAETTRKALEQALELLGPGGIISLLVYVGHAGGEQEHRAILAWLEGLPETVLREHHNPDCASHSPRLYTLAKG
ncbi:MAG: class I SAM-dependent methyltransferase [Gammaproteobacteria bacterium]|jgi:predicted methyltransferase